jgi:type IV pilus assembly protein PilM
VEKLKSWLLEPDYPLTAIEVRPRSVGAVRAVLERRRVGLGTAASVPLADGTLNLSMVQPNVVDVQAFREVVRAVLERAGIGLQGEVGLVLPDPVARVSLVPANDLAGKGATEAEDLIRFKLRKAVPFDIKDARVAFRLPRVMTPDAQAVAVVMARPVLEGYEEALTSLGLQPGLVELSGMAILGAVEVSHAVGDRLIVNWDDGYVSLLLTRAGEPVLVRTLTGEAASTHDDVVREVANTVLYYREKLGGAGLASVVVRSAVLTPAQAASLLREPLGMAPELFDPWLAAGGSDDSVAGQAVAGAAACVAGRAS